MLKSKIGLPEQIWGQNPYDTFFLGHPVHLFTDCDNEDKYLSLAECEVICVAGDCFCLVFCTHSEAHVCHRPDCHYHRHHLVHHFHGEAHIRQQSLGKTPPSSLDARVCPVVKACNCSTIHHLDDDDVLLPATFNHHQHWNHINGNREVIKKDLF